jgi:HPt (histidine-containing phosphotransfer) domain-containing protein
VAVSSSINSHLDGNGFMNPTQPVTNLVALKEITGGNDEQLKKYIRMFLEGVPGQLESVAGALDSNDYDSARRRIHAMKPHLKFMGMTAAAGFAESIEQLCSEQNGKAAEVVPKVHEQFALVKQHCEQAIIELREKL